MIPDVREDNDASFDTEEQVEAEIEMLMITREYESMIKLDHPLIAELLEVYVDANFIYFVSPVYTGGEVNDLLFTMQKNEEISDQAEPIKEETAKPIIY